MATYDTADMEPSEIYKLLIGLVVPRPIAWVGTQYQDQLNLAPFSFFNTVSADPPVIVFSPTGPSDSPKDTLFNISETGMFTHNVVSRSLAERMNISSGSYPAHVDEFALAGVTPVMGDIVSAPRVSEADASMECTLLDIVSFGEGNLSGNLVIGTVVRFHLADDLVENFRVDSDRLDAVGRMAGAQYATTKDRFALERPD